jgi:hypothetical protein
MCDNLAVVINGGYDRLAVCVHLRADVEGGDHHRNCEEDGAFREVLTGAHPPTEAEDIVSRVMLG